MTTSPASDRTELLLRTSRRSLWIVLALVVLVGTTLIAHVVRPGSLLSDWAARVPWLFPLAIVALVFILQPRRATQAEIQAMLGDEFRQANLARAQRVALVTVLVTQIPMPLLLADLTTVAALTVMAVATVTIAVSTLIFSFLVFDRD